VLPPRPERLTRQRRRHAEARIAKRVAALGFVDVRAYLADRLLEREWLLVDVAAEVAADRRTVRRLMQQVGVTRRRRTARQLAVGERAGGCSRSPGSNGAPPGWRSWALRTWPAICRPATSSNDGRSSGYGPSLGLVAPG